MASETRGSSTWIQSALYLPLRGEEPDGSIIRRHRALVLVLTSAAVFHAWHALWRRYHESMDLVTETAVLATGMTLALVLVLVERRSRLALVLAAAVSASRILLNFPNTYNHLYLEAILLLSLALFDPDPEADEEEHRSALSLAAWIGLTMIVWTGIKKLLFGSCFQGQYFVYLIAYDERFRSAFGWLLPDGELARIDAIGPPVPGASGFEVS